MTGARCHLCEAPVGHLVGCLQAAADLRAEFMVDRLITPKGWQLARRSMDGAWFVYRNNPQLSAIFSVEAHGESLWLHISVAGNGRVPTWDELRNAKDWLLGDVEAYMVAPPRARYVNINPNVLHLFAPVDQEHLPLPDFTAGSHSL